MSWTQRGLLVGVVGLGALVVMSRCGGGDGSKAGLDPKKSPMKGAVYATAIPVYPVQKVVDFYTQNLPQGAHRAEADEESVSFEWIPPGSVEGEEVHVTIREGRLQIGETIKAKSGA